MGTRRQRRTPSIRRWLFRRHDLVFSLLAVQGDEVATFGSGFAHDSAQFMVPVPFVSARHRTWSGKERLETARSLYQFGCGKPLR